MQTFPSTNSESIHKHPRADQAKEDKRPHADAHKYGYTEKPLFCALSFLDNCMFLYLIIRGAMANITVIIASI